MIRLKQNEKRKIKKVSELKAGDFFKFNSRNTINVTCNHIFIKVEELYKNEEYCYDLTANRIFSLKDDLNHEVILIKQVNALEFVEEV